MFPPKARFGKYKQAAILDFAHAPKFCNFEVCVRGRIVTQLTSNYEPPFFILNFTRIDETYPNNVDRYEIDCRRYFLSLRKLAAADLSPCRAAWARKRRAAAMSLGTPRPSANIIPRLACALAWPSAAALANHWEAA